MVATSMNINMNQISSSLPRFGLGMAALGRPGYINLNRASVFDKSNININPNSNSNNTSNTSTNTSTNTSEVQQVRSVERMQTQANDVIHTLFAKNNEKTQSQSKFQEMSMLNLPWLDCARSYGLSEKFVGDYLKDNEIHPDQVYVSSKWGYEYVADWNVQLEDGKPHEVKDHSVEVSNSILNCHALLCVEYVICHVKCGTWTKTLFFSTRFQAVYYTSCSCSRTSFFDSFFFSQYCKVVCIPYSI